MATVTEVLLSCDVCGNAKDVQTRTFELDGTSYEIDLCPHDGDGLSKAAARYAAKARKVAARQSPRRGGRRRPAGRESKASGPGPRKAQASSGQAAGAGSVRQDKGVYVYGILPADIELAADMPGIGAHPGLLRVVRRAGLAALVSEVDLSARPGSPDDRQAHREILDATAAEVPVLPLRFGTILPSEDAVAGELLAAHHDAFADALEQLEGRAQFLVTGRYVEKALADEVVSRDKQAAQLRDRIDGSDPGAARDARIEFGEILQEAVAARREKDTRAVQEAMAGVCVASAVREPSHDLDAVRVAFLVAADEESEVERVVDELAREWEGQVRLRLLGPMAAYDFVGTAQPEQ